MFEFVLLNKKINTEHHEKNTSVTRFVDRTPDVRQPYYMIQYTMPWRHKIHGKYSTSPIPEWEYGQSNIVDCRELE